MTGKFQFGDRIEPSAEDLKTFRNWAGRHGTVIGRSSDENVWEVTWDARSKIETILEIFIGCSSDQDASFGSLTELPGRNATSRRLGREL